MPLCHHGPFLVDRRKATQYERLVLAAPDSTDSSVTISQYLRPGHELEAASNIIITIGKDSFAVLRHLLDSSDTLKHLVVSKLLYVLFAIVLA